MTGSAGSRAVAMELAKLKQRALLVGRARCRADSTSSFLDHVVTRPALQMRGGPDHTRSGPRVETCGRSAGSVDHARADGDPGCLVDQDERARGAVLRVRVAQQRHGGAQLDAADLVERELAGLLVA